MLPPLSPLALPPLPLVLATLAAVCWVPLGQSLRLRSCRSTSFGAPLARSAGGVALATPPHPCPLRSARACSFPCFLRSVHFLLPRQRGS